MAGPVVTGSGLSLRQIGDIGPLYAPVCAPPGPAVMILHGSEGAGAGWSHRFAAILAAHGQRALPYAYGGGDVWGAGDIRDVDISVIPDAAERLSRDADITAVDLFGWSRGGELAMHLGAIGAADLPIRRLAAHAPADHCQPAFVVSAFRGGDPSPAATATAPRAWRWPGQDARLVPGTAIEIERFPRPVFLSVGDADQIWDHAMTLRLADRLAAAGNPADLFVGPGQDHAFDFNTEPHLWARLLAFLRRA